MLVTVTSSDLSCGLQTLLQNQLLLQFVVCDPLDAPGNGSIVCDLGGDGDANPRDSCRFTCNEGFILRGSIRRECQFRSGMTIWTGNPVTCEPGQ